MSAVRLRAFIWCLLALGAAYACVMQLSPQYVRQSPIQTNLLALLPTTERNPVAEEAVTKLADVAGNRTIFLIGDTSLATATAAARYFAKQLHSSNRFKTITADIPPVDPTQLISVYLQHQFNFLSTQDRVALKHGQINLEERLQQKLYSPFHFGLTVPVAKDPFALTDGWLENLPLNTLKLASENNMLVTRSTELIGAEQVKTAFTWVYVSADLTGSAYDNHVQRAVVDAVTAAELKLGSQYPSTQVLRTGAVFYAEKARVEAEQEMNFIGMGSLFGMLTLLYLLFRSVRPLALGLLSVAFGIGSALAVTIGVYGEIHLITLVFGASLVGEAIDYAIQYFAAHLGAGKNWQAMAALKRIAPGLTIALLTSLLGYIALILVPFPALSQIGLFALVGLSAAWLSVFLLLPALLNKPNQRDPEVATMLPQYWLAWWQAHMGKPQCYAVSALIIMVAIPGWLQVQSNDDVRLLIARPPVLAEQESKIRTLANVGASSQFFLIEGKTVDALLRNEERLIAKLNTIESNRSATSYQGLSQFIPSIATQKENRAIWASKVFSSQPPLAIILDKAGFEVRVVNQLAQQFKASEGQFMQLDDWLASPMSAVNKHLWLGETDHGFASVGLLQGIHDLATLQTATTGLDGVTFVDKAGSISRLLQHYREWGGWWLLGLMVLVFVVLLARYSLRQATTILAPPILAIVLTVGVFGYLQIPLSLFNIMGFILVLGVGVNYSIFLRESGPHTPAALAGVLLSAGTTLLSYGLLSFSAMPSLFSFGFTLLVGVGVAVLLAPIGITFDQQHA